LVASLNRPGGNLTGNTVLTHALDAKRLQLIHQMVPRGSTIGVLFNPKNADAERQLPDLATAAQTLGQNIRVFNASSKNEINEAFTKLVELRADALIISSDAFLNEQTEQLAALASAFSIPAIAARRELVVSGLFLSYGPSITQAWRQQGVYIGRILKGEKPGDLPVEQPTKFELVLNLRTAKRSSRFSALRRYGRLRRARSNRRGCCGSVLPRQVRVRRFSTWRSISGYGNSATWKDKTSLLNSAT
jgi:putative ABC transport system substrate-binding protein